MATVREFPGPPRLTGAGEAQFLSFASWGNDFYRSTVVRFSKIEARVDRAAALEALPTTATLADVITKVNAVIAALQEQETT